MIIVVLLFREERKLIQLDWEDSVGLLHLMID
jgi:hypothetical protein